MKRGAFLLPTLIAVASCGSEGQSLTPECGSESAKSIVVKLAADEKSLVQFLRHNPDPSFAQESVNCEADQECGSLIAEAEQLYASGKKLEEQCNALPLPDEYYHEDCPSVYQTPGKYEYEVNLTGARLEGSVRDRFVSEHFTSLADRLNDVEGRLNTRINAIVRESDEKFDNLAANITYRLERIVMTDRNSTTGAVTCKALLVGDIPGWGAAENEVTFLVERTTDGEDLVTVEGL